MYRVLIAEDEQMVVRGLTRNIDWNSFGFEIAGTVANGKRALAFFENEVPDVLLTDIRMPIMSGIELMEIVSKKHPALKIVVLSGYSEFEYAKQAIRSGAVDYLLKPTDVKTLEQTFLKIKKDLDEDAKNKIISQKAATQLQTGVPLIKREFLSELVKGNKKDVKSIRENLENLDIFICEKCLCALLLSIDSSWVENKIIDNDDLQLLEFAVENVVEELLEAYSGSTCFFVSPGKLVIILSSNEDDLNILDSQKRKIAWEILHNINYYLKIRITIGMGRVVKGYANIKTSYAESMSALEYQFYEGQNRIIDIGDVRTLGESSYSLFKEDEEKLLEYLRYGEPTKVKQLLINMFNNISGNKSMTMEYIQTICLELLIAGARYVNEIGGDLKEIFSQNIISFSEISRYKTIYDMQQWIVEVFEKITAYINSKRKSEKNDVIRDIKKHIMEYYYDDITLNGIAELFFINPEYLSRLFKKKTGQNFVDFLTEVRIGKAKELIKSGRNLKMQEIAEKIGYKDVKYFSKVFKKYVNQNPASFKNI